MPADTEPTADTLTATPPDTTAPHPEEVEEEKTETKPEVEGEYVEFKPPKDFHAPEASDQQNGEFDLVCSFKVKPDGTLCMTKLGDTAMPVEKGGKKRGRPPGRKMPDSMHEYGAMFGREMNAESE